jgi:hypothetical protein
VRQLLLKNNFFLFIIILSVLSLSGCEKKYNTIVDSLGNAPALSNASFSFSVVNTDTINIAGQSSRSSNDTLTIKGIAKVNVVSSAGEKEIAVVGYSLNNFNSSFSDGMLHDDGIFPDVKANDTVYTGYVEFQIQRVVVGAFSLDLWSESTSGYISNTVILPLQIVRLNHPPVLSNLVVDSLISLKGIDQNYFQITIAAMDPDGQADIRTVYFNSFKPDGSPSSGNPFYLYDDGDMNGASGDSKAGDGLYSLKVGLPSSTGTYQFKFSAIDRSNDTSNVIIKNIIVTN